MRTESIRFFPPTPESALREDSGILLTPELSVQYLQSQGITDRHILWRIFRKPQLLLQKRCVVVNFHASTFPIKLKMTSKIIGGSKI